MEHREPVRLSFDPNSFTGRMRLAAEAADSLNRTLQRNAATWEPHDWSEWD